MLKVVLSTILGVSQGLNPWEILNADITCCPQHTSSPGGCEAEPGSDCVWVGDGDEFDADLVAKEGSACLGAKFYKCKKDANDIDACCAPACLAGGPKFEAPPGSPADAKGTPPNCGPARCELGENYKFEGSTCRISGDPHTYLPNGDKHDFQGTPAINFGTADNPVLKNQFFYFHPCHGSNLDQIPIKVLGTHYHWGTRSVSGIDYLTVILTDKILPRDKGTKAFNLFLSSGLHSYGKARAGTNYDNNDPAELVDLVSGTTTHIGTRFKVSFTQINHKSIWVKIIVDDTEEFKIYMAGQTNVVDGRYRMHYVQMDPPSSMKCHACGLCGDYKRYSTGLHVKQLEACDGSLVDYRAGWNPAATPEAYDADGWTWEYNFVMNDCSEYDITDNIPDGADPTDPCPAAMAAQVATACENAVAAQSTCCNKIGGTFCDGLLTACKVDACAEANGDATAINAAVQELTINAIEDVCNNPDLNVGDEPQPALQCPPGSVMNGGASGTYNDISGCGLESCAARYEVANIEDCEAKCRQNGACKGFTWAPLNGDQNHQGVRVCTMYNSDTATSSWAPNQIFCALQPNGEVVMHCDNTGTLQLSTDGGATFEDIRTETNWGTPVRYTVERVTPNTVLRVKCVDVGFMGGFIATVNLKGATYSTSNPIENGNWALVHASDGVYAPLDYKCKTCWPWRISTPDIAADAVWIWNKNVHNTLIFEFDFGNIVAVEEEMEEFDEGGMFLGYQGLTDNSLLVKASIGVMLLICVFAVYVRNKKKGKEYVALKDEGLSGRNSYSSMDNQV